MSKVTESIWHNKKVLIPMADVSHIVRDKSGDWIIFKHSKTNPASKFLMKYEPAIWLEFDDAKQFRKDYCFYRHELDEVNV